MAKTEREGQKQTNQRKNNRRTQSKKPKHKMSKENEKIHTGPSTRIKHQETNTK